MYRSLSLVGLALALGACQPAADQGPAAVAGVRDAVPLGQDWQFITHGGSADLDFGDDVGPEAVSVFHLGCLPGSKTVRATWSGAGEAVLTSGTATGTFRYDTGVPADHPVFSALRAGGTLSVGLDDTDLTLTGSEAGRARIAAFFDYCNRSEPAEPDIEADPPALATDTGAVPSEGDDQPDDLPRVQPVEPGVDVVEPDHTAHQPVDG